MPELPEVEIVKQSLKKKIKLKKIKKVVVKNRNLRLRLHKDFEKNLNNRLIRKILRISKYLIIELDNYKYCVIHLGMSGTIHLIDKRKNNKTNLSFYHSDILPKKHNHIEIFFSNFKIVYNDPRRFGYFLILNSKSELNNFFLRIGPEVLSKKFNFKYLKKNLINKKKNIKNILLDQKFVSGIGNIYSNEILFYCKIHPNRPGFKITNKDTKKIILFSKFVIEKAIKYGGSTIRDFKNTKGLIGSFQREFNVYKRENQNCLRNSCNGKIIRKFISNRSCFFCNSCQK